MEYEEILKGIQKDGAYDFIVNNYWKLSNENLKDIAKEAIYLLDNDKRLIENLKILWTE